VNYQDSGIDEPPKVEVIPLAEEEPMFTEEIEDSSDIPLDILAQHLASGSSTVSDGFLVTENGNLEQVSVAEDADAELEVIGELNVVIPELGCGCRMKKVPVPFGGIQSWEHD
jgi:hypothetical protein